MAVDQAVIIGGKYLRVGLTAIIAGMSINMATIIV
jgi:hypothetical protein